MPDDAVKPPRGTRDFYPEETRLREWLFGRFRDVARRFGFEEVDAPIVEHEELFTRKAGEEIVEQLYHFTLHDRRLALRPEITPSIARMVTARAGALRLPLRWFSIPQCWRYERMTRGRKREHYQWNMDVWGEPSVTAEAELIAAVFALLEGVGLRAGGIRVHVNSRALLEETLRTGVLRDRPEAFEPLCVVIDKLARIGADAVVDLLVEPSGPVGLERAAARDVVDLLELRSLDDAARTAPDNSPSVANLRRLFDLLDAYGIADHTSFDGTVVRGLAYYTGVVFEAFDAQRKFRAVCGGGRFDRLVETLGGPAIPAVGFGFGDVVVLEILADQGRLPKLERDLEAVVFALGEPQRRAAIRLAQRLRREGRAVELVLGDSRLKRVLASADRDGAAHVYILGPDELRRGVVKRRDLETGVERDEKLEG